jgi:hypothetical protein
MLSRMILTAIACAICSCLSNYAGAFETTILDSACRVEGLTRPLRQTLIIVDEASLDLTADGKPGEATRRLNRSILSIAGVAEGQTVSVSAPRERITIYLARRDGSDLLRVFTGCTPVYSADEIERMEKGSSSAMSQVKTFIGRDIRSNIEKEKISFQTAILRGMVDATKVMTPAKAANGTSSEIGFLQAIALLRGGVDLGEGVPRVIVISPMDMPLARSLADVKDARGRGFDLAQQLGSDLQRAEVYLIGLNRGAPAVVRDFCHALFLGLKGRLAATSGETLPPFAEPPKAVRTYGGFIDYLGQKVPMQLRVSYDQGGSLVNSWMEVSVLRAVATPLTGKAICKSDDQCDVNGDGKEFAQSWVVDPKTNPTFNEKLPFSGVRYFSFSVSGQSIKGRVFDPNVVISGNKGTPFSLPFELSATPTVKF